MKFLEKKNLRTEDKRELKEANKLYTECISTNFLSKFLKGDNVRIEDFC